MSAEVNGQKPAQLWWPGNRFHLEDLVEDAHGDVQLLDLALKDVLKQVSACDDSFVTLKVTRDQLEVLDYALDKAISRALNLRAVFFEPIGGRPEKVIEVLVR